MARFSTVSLDEARRAVLPPRQATQEQYRQYIRQLTPEQAGRLELGEGDKPISERARLKAAARAEGVNLEIQRQGQAMVFGLSNEPPKAARAAARRSRK